MTGLALLIAEAGGPRVALALEAAAAAAALGERVEVFLAGEGVRLVAPEAAAPLATLRELGAGLHVCQTALAASGIQASDLAPEVAPSGLLSFLAGVRGFRLLLA